jgi:hypothetical protein
MLDHLLFPYKNVRVLPAWFTPEPERCTEVNRDSLGHGVIYKRLTYSKSYYNNYHYHGS